MTTPFTANDKIDHPALTTLIDWYLDQKMHGLVVAGTTGEWFSLTCEERKQLFAQVRDRVPQDTPLLAGCSALTIHETRDYVRSAAQLRYDGVLLTPPPYMQPTDEAIVTFYQLIAAQSPIPIVVYNWPLGVGREMSTSLLSRLAKLSGIVGIKNSTPDLQAFVESLRALQGQCKIFGIMPGDLGLGMLDQLGGDGCIGAAGVLGRDQPEFFEAYWQKDFARAKHLGSRDQRLMSSLFDGFTGKFGHAISTFKCLLDF
jgi:4-hydroxy-tetrahydrodipicolinate synthase